MHSGNNLVSGVYQITNARTGRYLTTRNIKSDNQVLIGEDGEHASFRITEVGSRNFRIVERSTGLAIGTRDSGNLGDLTWQRSPFVWTISQVPGLAWNISASAENGYWFDNKDECHWVTLSEGSADNANHWFLILVS
ncbi:hypothetical protein AAF712_014667 [Marasmius tenuissimus]|uniref:Ricin B lectin domain-containing protein n=1 Tax=Marasmius tenuissimus TaxID=585030 RepID=A0ABR2ZAE7_9AGAR